MSDSTDTPERERVECEDDCGAFNDPKTEAELRAAYEHWQYHGCYNGCSHGR